MGGCSSWGCLIGTLVQFVCVSVFVGILVGTPVQSLVLFGSPTEQEHGVMGIRVLVPMPK